MKKLLSCVYNFDNCCVELKFTDGSMIAIDIPNRPNAVYFTKKYSLTY